MTEEDKTRRLLRAHGFRSTSGRVDLLTALRRAARPLTQAQIIKRLRGKNLNRVSVYRALRALVEAGIVHRAYTGGRTPGTFESAERCSEDRCHPHFTCRVCSTTACLTGAVAPLVRGLPKGYLIERQKVHIDGLCPSCAPSGKRNRNGEQGALNDDC